jgi:hypothetical protein
MNGSTLTALAANPSSSIVCLLSSVFCHPSSVIRHLLSIVQFYYSFLFVSRLFFTQKYFSLNQLPHRLAI